MADIRAIIGLGNPGEEYAHTRHNAGFLAIDEIADEIGVNYWKLQDNCLVGIGKLASADTILLIKPQSFMNLSGPALKAAMKRNELNLEEILVIHDDLDLDPGELKFKRGGGHGGHNGIRSIIESIGSDFARLKIGIGRPKSMIDPADYVLMKLKGNTLEEFGVDTNTAADWALYAANNGLDSAMLKYHTESNLDKNLGRIDCDKS